MPDRLDRRRRPAPRNDSLTVYAVHRFSPGQNWKDAYLLVRYFVRSGQVRRDLGFQVVRPTLALVREHVPPGYNMQPPKPDDEPTLVESWI